jgi:hypothetical protein
LNIAELALSVGLLTLSLLASPLLHWALAHFSQKKFGIALHIHSGWRHGIARSVTPFEEIAQARFEAVNSMPIRAAWAAYKILPTPAKLVAWVIDILFVASLLLFVHWMIFSLYGGHQFLVGYFALGIFIFVFQSFWRGAVPRIGLQLFLPVCILLWPLVLFLERTNSLT